MNTILERRIPVTFTKNAIIEIKNLLEKENFGTNKYLRIGVKGGGCAGFSYILDFDSANENDTLFEVENIRIIIDKSQEMYLYNCEIDFKSGLENRGFIFNNPNATTTCGCGTSFSA